MVNKLTKEDIWNKDKWVGWSFRNYRGWHSSPSKNFFGAMEMSSLHYKVNLARELTKLESYKKIVKDCYEIIASQRTRRE
jgi:hypothetical protein